MTVRELVDALTTLGKNHANALVVFNNQEFGVETITDLKATTMARDLDIWNTPWVLTDTNPTTENDGHSKGQLVSVVELTFEAPDDDTTQG